MLFVKVAHCAKVNCPNVDFEKDFKHVPLPEEQAPVRLTAEGHEVVLLILRGESSGEEGLAGKFLGFVLVLG